MKLTLDTKSFVEAVTWATKTFDQKDNAAYVAFVVNKDGSAHLFHANPSSFMKSPFQVLDSEFDKGELTKDSLSLALEGRYLQRLAGALSGGSGPLEVYRDTLSDNASLEVKTTNGRFTIPLLAQKVAAEPSIVELGEVDDREYFDALQRLSKLCDSANAGFQPALGAVDIKLEVEGKQIVVMATDRYALGEITVPFEPSDDATAYVEENGNILLPFEDATLISPSKGLTSSTTLVHEPKGKKFGYVFGDSRVALFSLKDAEAIPYKKLKERATASVKNSFQVDANEFRKAIQTVSNLAWDEPDIFFDITEDGFVIGDSHRTNKMSVQVDNLTIDQSYSVKFVRSIINEAFAPVSTQRMNLKWLSEKSTFLLEPVLDDGTPVDNVFVFVIPSY